jgi:hypothetical protein
MKRERRESDTRTTSNALQSLQLWGNIRHIKHDLHHKEGKTTRRNENPIGKNTSLSCNRPSPRRTFETARFGIRPFVKNPHTTPRHLSAVVVVSTSHSTATDPTLSSSPRSDLTMSSELNEQQNATVGMTVSL